MISITLNGEQKEIENNSTLAMLVDTLELQDKRFAVEVNEDLVPRSEHAQYQIQNNDQIEIVHAIGGG